MINVIVLNINIVVIMDRLIIIFVLELLLLKKKFRKKININMLIRKGKKVIKECDIGFKFNFVKWIFFILFILND